MKTSFFVRFLVVAAIYALYIFALVEFNWFDGLLTGFWPAAYLICIVLGVLCAGITKGALPNKKIIKATKEFKDNQQAIIGYWAWALIWVVGFVIWLPFYAAEI